MTPEVGFQLANVLVLPGWFLLAVAPRWRWSVPLAGRLLPAVLAAIYLGLAARAIGAGDLEVSSFATLEGVRTLFLSDAALLAGWMHFLAFDLFVGAWQVDDAVRRGVRHAWVLPCLGLTFLFGPLGLLGYLAVRLFGQRPAPAVGS